MSDPLLGPVVGATLLAPHLKFASHSYQSGMGYTLVREERVSQEMCDLWNAPALLNNPMHILAAANGHAWLRIVEDRNCTTTTPLKTQGWMALEVNVANVDVIRKEIDTTVFKIIGEPAYLQISDAIKAMQVIGPCDEVSYITQIDKPVPPFNLPMTQARTGSLFIPVLCTRNRDASLAFYEALNQVTGLKFDTKVTVLNNAWGHDIEHQYPVATLQLAGNCLFEIDQVTHAHPSALNAGSLPSGIAMITCMVDDIEFAAKQLKLPISHISNAYYPSAKVILATGPAGELIELLERPVS
ncbi:hypothetical protein [Paraglaciecola polaris]|uniref:VOC family protein n=1 Tax=Paraglaciecola polaris TaxID=222814 RepID=UPI0030EE2D0C|tara:strand:- start:601 stop:1497 length:897 start_codon:yes stop_codon:yes gene_type:complete